MAVTLRGSGQVPVQIVQTVKTDTFSTTSTTFQDVTGLSVTITPTNSSNRILVFANVYTGTSVGGHAVQLQLLRGSTNIIQPSSPGNRIPSIGQQESGAQSWSQYWGVQATYIYLDNPSTTSATTYKIMLRSNTGVATAYINRNGNYDDNAGSSIGTSQLIVMELSYA